MHDEELKNGVSEDSTAEKSDGLEGQRFAMGITPFGHIGVSVSDASGNQANYIITSPDEASKITMHFIALTSMMIQSGYANAIQEQALAQKLMEDSKLWTPS